ncbi:type II restriction endonuclease [Pseudomonas syringae]|uniref:type II restriction endonuclease n=1 Tax=Pseudomonas syringae TaxID=317 RepID=UPI00042668C3|nr:type II restriction endonuclease [Pseudomonas syringae]QWB06815.1 restriction endonuclease [Pseudomonas syringae]UOF18633.1 restriction endonuclease [Pseudomonas syringae CC440]UZA80996.1 restriction endonuclease [Pseudomonas syringae]
MFNDSISDYFEGVAAKYLSAVDADPIRSNQHEIGGLPSAGFQQHLGAPGKDQEYKFHAKQIYVTDDSIAPEIVEATVTWYDCRRKQPHRRPEYRLYYSKTAVSELICEGDFLLVAKMLDGSLLMIFSPAGSTTESQLRLLFGLSNLGDSFKAGSVKNIKLHLPVRLILEGLGIETGASERTDDIWLEKLIVLFGGNEFPTTSAFSKFARETVEDVIDPLIDPDQAILGWMEHEEKLFRIYERHIVQKRLCDGFGDDGSNVDEFVSFSLSVQNRRKSRVGHAFEGYLTEIFKSHGLLFEQGGRKGFTTENNSKPDFVFPNFRSYKDESFPSEKLYMLGAKTTCKDRWRQVLSEANRIAVKHLITLEPAISQKQTSEMQFHALQLIVPRAIHSTYSSSQVSWLMELSEFIELVKEHTE